MKRCFETILIFMLAISSLSCENQNNPNDENPINTHKCYLLYYGNPNSYFDIDSFYFDSNNNLVKHLCFTLHSNYSVSFEYNIDKKIVQTIYLCDSEQGVLDTTFFEYSGNILTKSVTIRYERSFSDPFYYVDTFHKYFYYENNGDIIKSETYNSMNYIVDYQEQHYLQNKLIKYVNNFFSLELIYDTVQNTLTINKKNGEPYKKVWYDNKNSAIKNFNIYNSNNIRILFDKIMTYNTDMTQTGFLESVNSPIKIEFYEFGSTYIYSYEYNEFDYPISNYGGNLILNYDCYKN